jgi:sigma-B regulation protein RsbU (phosphoserine phosphatase)
MDSDTFRILLISNGQEVRRQVEETLAQARIGDYKLAVREKLDEGLALLGEGGSDVALMDLSLPDGAGLSNVKRAQDAAPRVPVIVLGEADDERVALEAVSEGAQDYLVKGQLNSHVMGRAIRYAIERERSDAALLEAEQKYRGIFEHIVEGIFQTSPEGRYISANPALARIYGYASPEELTAGLTDIGKKLYVRPERRMEFIQLMQGNDTVTGFESEIYRKDGSVIWIAENVRAIRNAGGKLLYYEGTVEDISDRRRAEERLRHSEELYHSLVETLPQNIFRKDAEMRFTFVNQRFCQTLGRPASEIIGKTDLDFYPAELAEKYRKDDQRVMAEGKTFEATEEYQPSGNERFYVQVVKTPVHDAHGKVIGLQGIFWDISERRRAEEQIRRASEELARSREALRKKNEQMEDDLKMAREIQQTMLPQQYPTFPRDASPAASHFRFCHRYLPTGTVGGDYFNVMALSDTEAGIFICDVMGHGVRSALVAAMVRALAEELKPLAGDPGKLLTQLNRDLCAILKHTGSPMLTTAFYAVADAGTGRVRFANAGHPKQLLAHRATGKLESLGPAPGKSKPALGLFENAMYVTADSPLAEGDLLMMFTDGLYEVEGADQQLYTEEMLANAVRKRIKLPASKLFDELLAEIREFSQAKEFMDDVCLVGMEVESLVKSGA